LRQNPQSSSKLRMVTVILCPQARTKARSLSASVGYHVSPTSPTGARLRSADQAEPGDSWRTSRDPSFEASIAYTPASSGTSSRHSGCIFAITKSPHAGKELNHRRVSIRAPRGRRRRLGRPSQEGATPKPGRCVGPMWRPSERWRSGVGRRVRISFAPAESHERTVGRAAAGTLRTMIMIDARDETTDPTGG
jgi:hypothetical protein